MVIPPEMMQTGVCYLFNERIPQIKQKLDEIAMKI